MRCPRCQADTRVVDSRDIEGGIRRRRECLCCGERFWTYERPELLPCPRCGHPETRVLSLQLVQASLRRQRECVSCGYHFATSERIERAGLVVIKRDGRREEYSREKLVRGVRLACAKRPVSEDQIEAVVDAVEQEIFGLGQAEVPSRRIGEAVVRRLRELDEVAYVRFASVYRQFRDIDSLLDEIAELKEWKRRVQETQHQLPLALGDDGLVVEPKL